MVYREEKVLLTYKIDFMWDDEVDVWIATSEDVRGLVLEDSSFDVLIYRVKQAVPELLAMEEQLTVPQEVLINYSLARTERLETHGRV